AGETASDYLPGAAPDAGAITLRKTGSSTSLLPLSFSGLGAFGSVSFADAGGGRADDLFLDGTSGDDRFNVTSSGDLQILESGFALLKTVAIHTPGVNHLTLDGLAGNDVFNVPLNHPFALFNVHAGDSASNVLNLTGNGAGSVTLNLPSQTATEAGFTQVGFSGIAVVNVNAG